MVQRGHHHLHHPCHLVCNDKLFIYLEDIFYCNNFRRPYTTWNIRAMKLHFIIYIIPDNSLFYMVKYIVFLISVGFWHLYLLDYRMKYLFYGACGEDWASKRAEISWKCVLSLRCLLAFRKMAKVIRELVLNLLSNLDMHKPTCFETGCIMYVNGPIFVDIKNKVIWCVIHCWNFKVNEPNVLAHLQTGNHIACVSWNFLDRRLSLFIINIHFGITLIHITIFLVILYLFILGSLWS